MVAALPHELVEEDAQLVVRGLDLGIKDDVLDLLPAVLPGGLAAGGVFGGGLLPFLTAAEVLADDPAGYPDRPGVVAAFAVSGFPALLTPDPFPGRSQAR